MKEFNLTPALTEKLNKLSPSPSDRAQNVLAQLPKDSITNYDLTCFCIEYLALEAQNNMPYLLAPVKEVIREFYFYHYLRIFEGALAMHEGEREVSDIQSASGTVLGADHIKENTPE